MSNVPVIIGAGVAGLSLALSLSPLPVIVIGKRSLNDDTSSELAQGGIAAAIDENDNVKYHADDTVKAGCDHCDISVVKKITESAPSIIFQLEKWGVEFDKDKKGNFDFGLEAAHSNRRIVHAKGDSTGSVIMKTLVDKAKKTDSITLIEGEVLSIEKENGIISSVIFFDVKKNGIVKIETENVVIATGSAVALWKYTTVPFASWGSGLLLAKNVGANFKDLEFVQFHPTALDIGVDPMPLVSEAVRGDGAVLVNDKDEQFVDALETRDIVSRAVWDQLESGKKVFLDARMIENFKDHFPTIYKNCINANINPKIDLIPVKPAAHYHMGGIETDVFGRTNIDGLFACGECACSGFHGANRLASNSLLESIFVGMEIAKILRDKISLDSKIQFNKVNDYKYVKESDEDVSKVKEIMNKYVGVCRNKVGLEKAIEEMSTIKEKSKYAMVAYMIAKSALLRGKSKGAHKRNDNNGDYK